MLRSLLESSSRRLAAYLQADHMKHLGIANTMRLAGQFNALRTRKQCAARQAAYRNRFAELIRENGESSAPREPLRDGWVIDTSQSWPHLSRLLDDAEQIIEERGGMKRKQAGAYRSFFQNILEPGDLDRSPSLLDFALSSDVLSVVCHYLKCIPVLLSHLPGGVRFAESSIEYDDHPETLKDSQLFHIDYFSKPCVYVIVLLRDVTLEHGPFCFVPSSVSQKTAAALNYWGRGRPYRLSDAEVYSVMSRSEVIPMTYPAGTVLFLDPSRCLHYGSRQCVKRRYQLMYAFGTGCRTDFHELLTKRHVYPSRPESSRLAKLVLNSEG